MSKWIVSNSLNTFLLVVMAIVFPTDMLGEYTLHFSIFIAIVALVNSAYMVKTSFEYKHKEESDENL